MSDRRIEPGDRVTVHFAASQMFSGHVESMPQNTGDCWVIVEDDGWVHHVQTFEQITKTP